MITRPFASAGIAVPVIGQGTWMIEGSREKEKASVASLRLGLDLGMTHIDTAEMYGDGRAEELVGEAVNGRRDEVFLASKVLPSNASYQGTIRACERSLRRLRTTWIDLYMLHWAGSHPIAETMRAMEKLVADGKIRYIGVSNLDVDQVRAAQKSLARERLACNQVLYHLGDRGIERKLIPYCASQQIAVVAYSPFGHSRFRPPESVRRIAAARGFTPRQVVLNFLTRHSALFTIPKSSNPDHTRENAGATGWELTPDEVAAIGRECPAPGRDVPLGMI
jgi:diketogulonate reductase-like aldo/keto reductase